MGNTNLTHKWGILILRNSIFAYRTKNIFQFPPQPTKSMNIRDINYTYNHSNRVPRVRLTMRSNILLRSHGNYGSSVGHPNPRNRPSSMNLRGPFGQPAHPKSILFITLHPTHNNYLNG